MPQYSFQITEKEKNLRLDKFLLKKRGQYSRAFLQKLIKQGLVLVNNKKTKPGYLLRENDLIKAEITLPEKISLQPDTSVKFKIIYEDTDAIVLDKPAGLVVHPSPTHKKHTLINGLLAYIPQIKNIGENPLRPGLVHRLDKDTSGLMVIAKNNTAFQFLKNQFKQRKVEKKYIALVHGLLEKKQGVIDAPIARSKRIPTKQIISFTGKPALTKYKIIKRLGRYTLLEAQPKTGRMHQIRVHLSHLGHPIVCDRKYAVKKYICPLGLKRHFLHAAFLKIKLLRGPIKEFASSLPQDLEKFLKIITSKSEQA